jgi:ribosomal protein S18 acetylase RimI-like enzyme
VTIREGGAADVPAIGRVVVETWQSAYRGIVPDAYLTGLSPAARAEEWRDFLAGQDGRRFVVVAHDEGDDLVAFAAGGPERSGDPTYRGELYAIYVLPSCQGRGFGRALMRAVAGRLAAGGTESMLLWVLEANARARRFYEALGGMVVRRQPIELGGMTLTEVAYGWANLERLLGATGPSPSAPSVDRTTA